MAGVDTDATDNTLDLQLSYPWIEVPEGCKLVSVKYGVSDGTNVEIVSGLNAGDIVVFNPEWEPVDLSPETEEDAEPATPVPTASTPAPSSTPTTDARPKETASALSL